MFWYIIYCVFHSPNEGLFILRNRDDLILIVIILLDLVNYGVIEFELGLTQPHNQLMNWGMTITYNDYVGHITVQWRIGAKPKNLPHNTMLWSMEETWLI